MTSKSASIYFLIGILFLLVYIVLWIIPTGGLGIILGLPFIILGVILTLEGYKKKSVSLPTKRQQWNFILQLLLINFTILYLIAIAGNFTPSERIIGSNKDNIDVLAWPGLILLILVLLYFIGFAFSWKNKFIAGTIFIGWFIGVVGVRFLIQSDDLIFYTMVSVVLLILGILYVAFHFKKLP